MKQLAHLRQKAIELRTEHQLSLDDISARLNVSRTTVYYWIKDIPMAVAPKQRQRAHQQAGTTAMQAKYAALRQLAYQAT